MLISKLTCCRLLSNVYRWRNDAMPKRSKLKNFPIDPVELVLLLNPLWSLTVKLLMFRTAVLSRRQCLSAAYWKAAKSDIFPCANVSVVVVVVPPLPLCRWRSSIEKWNKGGNGAYFRKFYIFYILISTKHVVRLHITRKIMTYRF